MEETSEEVSQKSTAIPPVNFNDNHWVLVTINWIDCIVTVYDSLSESQFSIGEGLLKRLEDINDHKNLWQLFQDHSIQWQNDGHSYAFFMCWYAYQLAIGGDLTCWPDKWDERIAVIAQNIFISLIENKIVDL